MLEEPMTLLNLLAKASVQLYIVDADTNEPIQFGTGCIVAYRGRRFLLSVDHVTRIRGKKIYTHIVTGLPPREDGQVPFYRVGGLMYFEQFTMQGIETGNMDKITFLNGEPLDITFTTVGEDISLRQRSFMYLGQEIPDGPRVILNLDDAIAPNANDYFGFFGYINTDIFDEKIIRSEVTFKLNLSFKGQTSNKFLLFNSEEMITDGAEYLGTSGAPIFNSKGHLVGLACSVLPNSKSIFAFPIDYCKNLLDIAIDNSR